MCACKSSCALQDQFWASHRPCGLEERISMIATFEPLHAARVSWKPVKVASGRVCDIWSKVVACTECIAVRQILYMISEGVIISLLWSLFSLLLGASIVYTNLNSIILIQMLECKTISSSKLVKSLWILKTVLLLLIDVRNVSRHRADSSYVGQSFPDPPPAVSIWFGLRWQIGFAVAPGSCPYFASADGDTNVYLSHIWSVVSKTLQQKSEILICNHLFEVWSTYSANIHILL